MSILCSRGWICRTLGCRVDGPGASPGGRMPYGARRHIVPALLFVSHGRFPPACVNSSVFLPVSVILEISASRPVMASSLMLSHAARQEPQGRAPPFEKDSLRQIGARDSETLCAYDPWQKLREYHYSFLLATPKALSQPLFAVAH